MGKKQPCSRCSKTHPPINAQRRRFAEAYAVSFSMAGAARAAKYKARDLGHQGYELLGRADVSCELKHVLGKVTKRLELKSADVLDGLLRIARFDPADVFNDDGTLKKLSLIPVEVRRAIAGMRFSPEGQLIEIKLPDKVRSYELLGKNKRLFTEVFRHEGDINFTERIARGRRRAMGKEAEDEGSTGGD